MEAIRSGTAPLAYEIGSPKALERRSLAQLELPKSFGMTRGCRFGTIVNEVTDNDELIRQDLSLIFEVVKSKPAVSSSKKNVEAVPPELPMKIE